MRRPLPRIRRTARAVAVLALFLAPLLASGGCDSDEPPPGPPRCEPESELWLERLLKEGYRALSAGHQGEAIARFERVLELEAKHPEALRALAQARSAPPSERQPADGDLGPATSAATIQLAGEGLPSAIAIVHDRLDFQTLRELTGVRRGRASPGAELPVMRWFTERPSAARGRDVPEELQAAELLAAIDLIVLHDTQTATAAEAFVNYEDSGAATHFLIEADGTVFQTLDLAFAAHHTHDAKLDARSVAIDLVNPGVAGPTELEGGRTPNPSPGSEPRQGPPMLQAQGYTAPQLESLAALVRALCDVLPATPCTLPAPDSGGLFPRDVIAGAKTFRGIAGNLHLRPTASDPGHGFSWEAFARALALKN